jgi:hypothetical protein
MNFSSLLTLRDQNYSIEPWQTFQPSLRFLEQEVYTHGVPQCASFPCCERKFLILL